MRDETTATELGLNLTKGILLTGPVGCGKTSLMNLMRFFQVTPHRFILKSCRDVTFDVIRDGYDTIHRYRFRSFHDQQPKTYCFDDLGIENNLKYFGNECTSCPKYCSVVMTFTIPETSSHTSPQTSPPAKLSNSKVTVSAPACESSLT